MDMKKSGEGRSHEEETDGSKGARRWEEGRGGGGRRKWRGVGAEDQ